MRTANLSTGPLSKAKAGKDQSPNVLHGFQDGADRLNYLLLLAFFAIGDGLAGGVLDLESRWIVSIIKNADAMRKRPDRPAPICSLSYCSYWCRLQEFEPATY